MTARTSLFAIGLIAVMLCASPATAFFSARDLDPQLGQTRLALAEEGSGPLAPDAPSQVSLDERFAIDWGPYRIEGHSGIGIEAIVLSHREYVHGDLAALVPIDLALAWGPVSDPEWIRHLRVSQSEREYRWSFRPGTPLVEEDVISGSANMHMMPASPAILETLRDVREGDLVRISGYLVDISGPDGFTWRSSTVRTDTGLGACELVLVEQVEIVRP